MEGKFDAPDHRGVAVEADVKRPQSVGSRETLHSLRSVLASTQRSRIETRTGEEEQQHTINPSLTFSAIQHGFSA